VLSLRIRAGLALRQHTGNSKWRNFCFERGPRNPPEPGHAGLHDFFSFSGGASGLSVACRCLLGPAPGLGNLHFRAWRLCLSLANSGGLALRQHGKFSGATLHVSRDHWEIHLGRATPGIHDFFHSSGGASGLSVPYKMPGQHAHSAGNCLVAAIVPVPRQIAPASPSTPACKFSGAMLGVRAGTAEIHLGRDRMGCMFFIQWRCFPGLAVACHQGVAPG
jgi:hypothetical protein